MKSSSFICLIKETSNEKDSAVIKERNSSFSGKKSYILFTPIQLYCMHLAV